MAQSIEDLSVKFENLEGGLTKKLEGLEALLQKLTDKFDDASTRIHQLESAPLPPPPPQLQQVLDKLDETATRLRRLEDAPLPQPPPRPSTAPPPPPHRWVN
ncbi:unnamed protein product [Urochloa humidicola]